MPLGLALSGRAGFPVSALISHARAAEEAGFGRVYTTETFSDPVTQALLMGAATSEIEVGTAITNLALRHPAAMAMTCAVAGDAMPGRFVLGVGTGNPEVNAEVLGLPAVSPLAAVREYVQIFRSAQTGRVDIDGEVYRVLGLELARLPLKPVPIHVAALQSGMLRVAGERADGVILHLSSPEAARVSAGVVRRAAAAAGRRVEDVEVSCMVPVCPDEDATAALDAARQTVLRYALHPVAGKLFAESGHGEEMDNVARLMRDRGEDAARSAVGVVLARSFVAHGTPDQCREQIQAYREYGVDVPIAFPMPSAAGDWDACVRNTIYALEPIT